MGDELATSNVDRSYSLAATSIAIFTFMLFFIYPKSRGGEIDPLLFEATLVVMGVATFSFVIRYFPRMQTALKSASRGEASAG